MLLGFKKQFEPMILSHLKTHTIRAKRKRPPHVGEICHCYTGLRQRGPIIQKLASGQVVRQKMARLLGRWPCVKVQDVQIYRRGDGTLGVIIDSIEVLFDELDPLARSDGFRNFADMSAFWIAEHSDRHGNVDFLGDMIHWDPTKPAAAPTRSSSRRHPEFKDGKKL